MLVWHYYLFVCLLSLNLGQYIWKYFRLPHAWPEQRYQFLCISGNFRFPDLSGLPWHECFKKYKGIGNVALARATLDCPRANLKSQNIQRILQRCSGQRNVVVVRSNLLD